jgi:hypothetical protein
MCDRMRDPPTQTLRKREKSGGNRGGFDSIPRGHDEGIPRRHEGIVECPGIEVEGPRIRPKIDFWRRGSCGVRSGKERGEVIRGGWEQMKR